MAKVIKAENLAKAYQLGNFGTGTISRDIERAWARLRGKEDPYLKIGQVNDRSTSGSSDVVWSLKDINFEIEQGDAVGIIGRNGAGKSTLLKILSRVTSPTLGSVKIKGRIASLLEVGTGFHPELSGRENIYLNGAILGMRKAEIKRKFDEIVDFSGVERYIDTPVKRYSSGMFMRLAFAVAAHLESEILIVDEVLAVGDAEFQKKCLGKMGDISKGEGRTLLFVSHNMQSISSLCKTALLLGNGEVINMGTTKAIIDQYISLYSHTEDVITNTNTIIWQGHEKRYLKGSDKINLILNFFSNSAIDEFFIDFAFYKNSEAYSIHLKQECLTTKAFKVPANTNFKINLDIDPCFLVAGNYNMTLYIYDNTQNVLLWIDNIDAFEISNENYFGELKLFPPINAPIIPPFNLTLLNDQIA